MVACLGCKRVVWTYDHERRPLAGIMNMVKMPCPLCGTVGSFDGWASTDWQEMHAIADEQELEWRPDGQCRWFGNDTQAIADILKAAADQGGVGRAWRRRFDVTDVPLPEGGGSRADKPLYTQH